MTTAIEVIILMVIIVTIIINPFQYFLLTMNIRLFIK
jgi:hypothetical protein